MNKEIDYYIQLILKFLLIWTLLIVLINYMNKDVTSNNKKDKRPVKEDWKDISFQNKHYIKLKTINNE